MIKKALWLCIVVYIFGVLWVSLFRESVPQVKSLGQQRDLWALKVSRARAANAELRREVEGLKTDFRYMERVIRDDFVLYKEGELVILVEGY